MTSIDSQQPEKNHEDLAGQSAVEKIKTIVKDSPNCFFCSGAGAPSQVACRPMNVREIDERGHLWFLTADDNSLADDVRSRSGVTLLFQGAKTSEFMQIDGQANLSRDEKRIEELWEPILKTWFTNGVHDARIRVIEVIPQSGYYWDQKHGGIVAGAKMVVGALLGVTLDDSIQGSLSPTKGERPKS